VIGQKMLIVVTNQNPKNLNHHLKKEKKNHIWNVSGLARPTNQSGNNSVVLQNALKLKVNLKAKLKVVKNQKKSVKMASILLKMTVLVFINAHTVTDGQINIVHPIFFSMAKSVTGPKTSTVPTTTVIQTMTHQIMTHQVDQ